MRRLTLALISALALFLAPVPGRAQASPSVNDLAQAWLVSQGKSGWAPGAYQTCDDGTGDKICQWDATALGTQPTTAQLNALAAPVAAQQAAAAAAAAAFSAGIQITSSATPALNGTYAIDAVHQQLIAAEQLYILTKGTFTNGGTTKPWLDASNVAHTFPSTAEFTAFAEAVAQYLDALMSGAAPSQPSPIP